MALRSISSSTFIRCVGMIVETTVYDDCDGSIKPYACVAVQELHDRIHDLLQDRDPKARLDEQSSQEAHVPDASVPVAPEQVIAPVAAGSGEEGGDEGQQAPDMSAATASKEGDPNDTGPPDPEQSAEILESSDSSVPGPVAEGDVGAESAPDFDTSAPIEATSGTLNDRVVDDYIQVRNSPFLDKFPAMFTMKPRGFTFTLNRCLWMRANGKEPLTAMVRCKTG